MWILECDNHGQEKPTDNLLYGPKPRPLMPKPFSTTFSTSPTPCFCPPWNQTLRGYEGKREIMNTVPLVSTRWNPTPEQLQALEEMYRNGISTPSSQQIQQIAAKLRKFGKIEGKNVFYWFQNHKARERQKRRRQLELSAGKVTRDFERPERRQSGVCRTNLETKHPKKLPTITSNCSTASEYSASVKGEEVQECKQDKWTQLNCKELQQHNLTAKSTETDWTMDLSSPCMPLINNKVTAQKATGQENEKPFSYGYNDSVIASKHADFYGVLESGIEENHRTLQLFPVGSDDRSSALSVDTEEKGCDVSRIGKESTPNYRYFEFLPTKN